MVPSDVAERHVEVGKDGESSYYQDKEIVNDDTVAANVRNLPDYANDDQPCVHCGL